MLTPEVPKISSNAILGNCYVGERTTCCCGLITKALLAKEYSIPVATSPSHRFVVLATGGREILRGDTCQMRGVFRGLKYNIPGEFVDFEWVQNG